MAYTTVDNPELYFQSVLWTGDDSTDNAITFDNTDTSMQPNLIWLKPRTKVDNHRWMDSVRGVTKMLPSNSDGVEETISAGLASFDSNGFTLNTTDSGYNSSSYTYVAWNWKAGTSFTNDASATGVGTLDSTGSSSQTAGFSIVSYTSNGSSSQSVAHNLGGVPEMIISKNRDSSSSSYNYWTIFNHNLATANDKKLILNTSAGASTTNEWGDTDPTSTVYSLHTSGDGTTNHSSDKIISYCFRGIKGYSKFGSYTGNGDADGTMVYTGFKPAWTLIKRTDSTTGGSWILFDNKRGNNVRNPVDVVMAASNNQSEADWGTAYDCDYLSNGFKWRHDGSSGYVNVSGASYIYMAFAENPFVTSTGVPATAK